MSKVQRTEMREVILTLGGNSAHTTIEGGLRLTTGMSQMYVLPEHRAEFKELLVKVIEELER